jgi:DNA recombination-dependent growth factor C
MKLIDKSTLVAEIERRLEELYSILPDASKVENGTITVSEACNTGKYTALESFRKYIDTLEVKEVNLEEELDSMITPELKLHKALPSLFDVAKHFFELGLKA